MDQPPAPAVTTTPVAPAPERRLRRGLWQRYVVDTRRDADAASAAYRATTDARTADRKMIVILLTTGVSLTLMNFLREADHPGWMLTSLRALGFDGAARSWHDTLFTSPHARFWDLVVWAIVTIVCYIALPVFAIKVVLRERVRDYGLRARGVAPHGRLYAGLYVAVLPFVVAASFGGAFEHRYPFYHLAPHEGLWPYLWLWWVLYAMQFVALEFFFRGFMVHGLAPRFGYASVFVMMVPYNMIHFNKPMPEALAALGGAIVLGTLSLKSRSIWWGAALHISIAASMDVLALWHAHVLF